MSPGSDHHECGDFMKDVHGVVGYAGLLDTFIDGRVRGEWFQAALICLWVADRDFEGPVPDVQPDEKEEKTKSLLSNVQAGQLTPKTFGEAYAAIWAEGRPSTRVLASIVDLLHHYAYLYSPDPAIRSSDPTFFIDEGRLLDTMRALREVLIILTENQSV
jgi:hypothetical protein